MQHVGQDPLPTLSEPKASMCVWGGGRTLQHAG